MSFLGRILGLSSDDSKAEEVVSRINSGDEERVQLEEKGDPDENEVSDDDQEDEKECIFLDNLLFENDSVKYYKTEASKFVNNIEIWSGQRPLNKEHVKALARQFTREGHVMGTFKVVRSQDGLVRLCDGQHRMFALREIFKLQPDFDCDIIIELYETDTLESKNSLRLFEKANNVLNVHPEDMPNKLALSIVDKLSRRFKDIFRDVEEGKRCVRPYISKRIAFQKLKKAFEEHEINEDLLFNRILEYNENNRIEKLEIIDLSASSIRVCRISGCYLGFDKDCSWLDEIFSIYY